MLMDLEPYKKYLDKINGWLLGLSQRERLLALFTCLVTIYMVWEFLFMMPLGEEYEAIQIEQQVVQEQIRVLEDQIIAINTPEGSKEGIVSQHQRLQQDLQKLHEHLGIFTNELVSPTQMATILRDMFSQEQNLQLILLESLPAESMSPTLYKHGMVLKFAGDFFSVLHYLEQLEKLDWQIFWDNLEYKVAKYPMAEITMRIHTLSREKGWIKG